MKIFYPTAFATILSLSSRVDARRLHQGGGGHGGMGHYGGGMTGGSTTPRDEDASQGYGRGDGGIMMHGRPFVQSMSEEECADLLDLDCDNIDDESCSNIEMPGPPNFTAGMTDEEKETEWSEMQAARDEHRQKILGCACCTDATLQDLMPMEEFISSQGFGHGHMHHGGGGRPFVQAVIEQECTPDFDCSDFDEEAECNAGMFGPPSFASGSTPTTEEELEAAPLTEEENETAQSEARTKRHGHVLRCACCSDKSFEELMGMGDSGSYGGFHGMHHGGHGGGRPFAQTLVEDECDARDFDCNEEIDCENIQMPEFPTFTADMTDEEKEAARSELEEARDAHRQKILTCACCTDKSIQELIPEKEEGSFRPFGGGGHHGMMDSSYDDSESSVIGSGRPGNGHSQMHGHGGGGHMMQHMMNFINNNCPKHSCPGDRDSESCILLEFTATRTERRENTLNCVCCRDDGVSEIQENNSEEEVSVLLASLLADESVEVETEVAAVAAPSNPAWYGSSMLALSFAALVGVAFAML